MLINKSKAFHCLYMLVCSALTIVNEYNLWF